jgi:hypothetical protein
VKRLFGFVARSRQDIHDDVQEEFAFHLDMRIADLMQNCGRMQRSAPACCVAVRDSRPWRS